MHIKKISEWKPFSRFLLFIVFIPAFAGAMSGVCGVGIMQNPLVYFLINMPIILICVGIDSHYQGKDMGFK